MRFLFPVWLHADVQNIQNKIFNYAYQCTIHNKPNPAQRKAIQDDWERVKKSMDKVLAQDFLIKTDSKIAIRPPEPSQDLSLRLSPSRHSTK